MKVHRDPRYCKVCGRPLPNRAGRPGTYCPPTAEEEASPCYTLDKRGHEMVAAVKLIVLRIQAEGGTTDDVARALQGVKARMWATANAASNVGRLARSEKPRYKKTRSGWRRNADAPDRSVCFTPPEPLETPMLPLLLLIGCAPGDVELLSPALAEYGHDLDADTGAGTVDASEETDTAGANADCTGGTIDGWPERVTAAPTWRKQVTGCGTIIGALCADPDLARVDLDAVALPDGVEVSIVALDDGDTLCEVVVLDNAGENHAFNVAVDTIAG